MPVCLDTLLIGLYVLADDFLQPRNGPGRPPKISDSELICLAVAQVLLDCPGDRKFLALAGYRLRHLFPYLPKQSGYNKRVRALAPEICCLINLIAFESPSFCDRVWLLDTTPVPCGQSRETARRSELAGIAGYGYCRSQHRYFWGMKLVYVCSPDGMPLGFELVPANTPERPAAAEVLERMPLQGRVLVADKGFVGREFEQLVGALGARLVRPDRKDERGRGYGALGAIRQWIESVFDTLKGQLSLERHGARTLRGLQARIAQRLLALAAALRHNQLAGVWERSLIAYDH